MRHKPSQLPGPHRVVMQIAPHFVARVLGELLHDERLRQGLSQEALASMADIDRSHYAKIERGERPTSLAQFFRICEALGCSCTSVMKRVELNLPKRAQVV